ncbi:MAG: hypothetical protein EA359_13885 [Balneolaceae bacterium]|jgi:hypothetical protein|nr:MAG: hypothetical protein EA359_13885 [Balneolaceae bacterium]
MKLSHTSLQKIEFGNEPEDIYYCLIDLRISPGGLNIKKLRLTDPRNIDEQFRQNGCLMMFTGVEIEELIQRGDLDGKRLHRSLFRLAVKDGLIRE